MPEPERVGWWRTIGAVLAGSIVAGIGCALVLAVLAALHLVPSGFGGAPGHGWPWRIDGAWALAADLGPMLAVAFAFAGVTNWYLAQANGVHARRWPLALVATAVGWLPAADSESGLLVVSGGAAFCVVVVAARAWSAIEREPMPWSRPLLAGLLALTLVLAVTSVSYGTLHPLTVRNAIHPPSVELRDGRSGLLVLDVENRGPASARVEGVALVDDTGLRLRGARLGGARSRVPKGALKPRTIEPGASLPLFVELDYPPCRGPSSGALWTLRAIEVRFRVAGSERAMRLTLDEPLSVSCGSA